MKVVLNVIGYGLMAGASIWGITGYYASNLPTMIAMFAAGAICARIAEKMGDTDSAESARELGATRQYQVQQYREPEAPSAPGFIDPNQ